MSWTGKLVGGGIGWAVFGPLGALVGGVIGNAFDKRTDDGEVPYDYYEQDEYLNQGQNYYQERPSGSFSMALMALCAYVIQADAKVRSSEIQKVKEFVSANFSASDARDLMQALKGMLNQEFNLSHLCAQIVAHMGYYERLEICQFLYAIALADGELHPKETDAISAIAGMLGISDQDLRTVFGSSRPDQGGAAAADAYEVIGMSRSAANDELKKAYREQAKKFHPDRVAHLGEDYRKFAEEKFKKLQEAWSSIRKERGL
jgi:DnaJ like chaperone protein